MTKKAVYVLGVTALLAIGVATSTLFDCQQSWAAETPPIGSSDGAEGSAASIADPAFTNSDVDSPSPASIDDVPNATNSDPASEPAQPTEPEFPNKLKVGWNWVDDAWYYGSADGSAATGWLYQQDTWYWLNPALGGRMATGWIYVDGSWYHMAGSGAMQTGWLWKGGRWYYLNGSGAMAEGWKKLSGTWYYLNPGSGTMATGWLQLGKTWYFLDSSGAMVTGRRTINGRTSIFGGNGAWRGYEQIESLFTEWAQPESSSTNWLILVDTKRCKVGIFWGSKGNWQLQRMMDCAPGKASTPTKKGRFTVGSTGYYFDSGAARCFYFTQFSGNYLFHSVLYYQNPKPTSIMDGRVGMGLSHGCVRLKLENAKWIYNNIPRGTKVYIW